MSKGKEGSHLKVLVPMIEPGPPVNGGRSSIAQSIRSYLSSSVYTHLLNVFVPIM